MAVSARALRRALAAILVPLLAAPALAATIAVPAEAPTIAQALARARPGDVVLVACGTYREHDLVLPAGVSLWSGTMQPECAVIDAGGRGRVLICEGVDSTSTVVGFTLTGGRATGRDDAGRGGAVLCRNASPRLSRCLLTGNQAREGGALAVVGSGRPQFSDCRLVDNEALGAGGAVVWAGVREGRLLRCELRGNAAANAGGALYATGGVCTLVDCLLAANVAGVGGSALALDDAPSRLVGCTLTGNRAEADGGVILALNAATLLERCVVAFNSSVAVAGEGPAWPQLFRCNLYDNLGRAWPEPVAGQAGRNGNFSADPLFCDRATGDYRLRADSPCLPGNPVHGAAAPVGAFGQGCARR